MRKEAYNALVEHLGEEKTLLDRKLINILVDGLLTAEWEERGEWATYAQVFVELKKCRALHHYQRFQYYFTGGSSYDEYGVILIDLLSELVYKTDELIRLEEKLISYRN